MTIEKLPSGNYRITKMVKGKRYRATLDHRPTKLEAEEVIQEVMANNTAYIDKNMTFEDAAKGYITLKYDVLSPNTRRGYHTALKRLSEGFRRLPINDLDQIIIQSEINRLSSILSPKTVKNTLGLVTAVLAMYRPQFTCRITLPQAKPTEYYTPTADEVRIILDAVKDTRYYVPFTLGVCGMRRSEICAASINDIDGHYLRISKALVHGEDGKEIRNNAKTEKSVRRIYLSDELLERIHNQGAIYDGDDTSLYKRLIKEQDRHGIHRFRFHDLRAFFASYAHMQGIPDQLIQEAGGWKTDTTMKRIYRRTISDEYEESQKTFWNKLTGA